MGECVARGTLLPFLSRIYFVSIIKIFSSVPWLSCQYESKMIIKG
jgi:hypothetical protein